MRKLKVILSRGALLFAFGFVVFQPKAIAQVPRYDLPLKGGHVIDAKMDVAVSLGKIVEVGKDIPANQAGKVVDVSSLYLTPGLIDIHYHIGHGGAPLSATVGSSFS